MPDRISTPLHDDVDLHFGGFHKLIPHRVQNVLLVSSLYESFILEEEGLIHELVTSEYLDMNLSHAPRVSRVSTGKAALEYVQHQPVDLVITMIRVGQLGVTELAEALQEIKPGLPVVVLAGEPRELTRRPGLSACEAIKRVFVWSGDPKILLAIIKYIEDDWNAEHDTRVGDVRVIILVENSIRFYSVFLPLIYGEVVKLTQSLMSEGVSPMHRLLRMRARPKILLAETFEQACGLFERFGQNLLGIISDVRFPKGGELHDEAGLEFIRLTRLQAPYLPVMLQSSNAAYASAAKELRAFFAHKSSKNLLEHVRDFLLNNLGFGEFIFCTPSGMEVGRARDLRSFEVNVARIPEESLLFHAHHNHFSNWLMARTEFAVASRIRPRSVSEFATSEDLRKYLLATLAEFRERDRSGVVADFSAARLDSSFAFARIGSGSIGGKARGLAFINALIGRYELADRFPNVRIAVPRSAAIGTDVFDTFLELNNLRRHLMEDPTDEQIAAAFLAAKLPADIMADLEAFLGRAAYPLAVRSSSLLEDSQDRPFAGVYTTHMIPNVHPNFSTRLVQLCNAIKLVYASAFYRDAQGYLEATGRRSEEEKMGVILQEIVGSAHQGRFYPTFSGVVRSYNFYPTPGMNPQDGIASVALGLGKTVVEGGLTLLFCPTSPGVLPQFASTKDMLANSQRDFFALDISKPDVPTSIDEDANLLKLGLDVAEADGTLAPIGSVYSPENDAVYDGIFREGTRLVTFAHVLKSDLFPLAEILQTLLKIGREGMAGPVEIEFAVDLLAKPAKFGFLQIRPIVANEECEDIGMPELIDESAVCYSPKALGNGRMCDLYDILYVKPGSFDAGRTLEIVLELATLNKQLNDESRHCVLIGPGRWGSADRWLGIPVTWEQISSAQVIVETTLHDFVVTLSQGTHFFQNLTSLGVGYFTIDPSVGEGFIDWDWLASCDAVAETDFVRRVQFSKPLDVRLDGRSRRGVILKPPA
ncbi:MAG: histidine kinase [Planctomycetes bacterium]|nr:histidine kinase [Planctomycetota bacterium]